MSVQLRPDDTPAPEAEALVTIPIEQVLTAAPAVHEVDSLSRHGLASPFHG